MFPQPCLCSLRVPARAGSPHPSDIQDHQGCSHQHRGQDQGWVPPGAHTQASLRGQGRRRIIVGPSCSLSRGRLGAQGQVHHGDSHRACTLVHLQVGPYSDLLSLAHRNHDLILGRHIQDFHLQEDQFINTDHQ
ncbi:Hypp4753 [Branchiostoma lanceolatum]|uniref:Hypp4753 protein n=1 Tax=Branchiostoma lanceolatum TaxID=7740 RepID=A0A8K0A9W4_BRALA|nr:Hypp4753 [Branchiostoma lanceolatum]